MRPERPFEEPWQARAFAITVALHESGAFAWEEWSHMLGLALEAEPDRSYWRSWLVALEMIMLRCGMAGGKEVAAMSLAWREAADRTPHGEAIVLDG